MTIKAYVLVATQTGATKQVLEALQSTPGLTEFHEVTGAYDILVEIETQDLKDIPRILSNEIRNIRGIHSTTSLVTFPR